MRKAKDVKPFAHIPLEVIESKAVVTLQGKAFLALARIAANYRHKRNGMLTASAQDLKGIVSQKTLYGSALPQLVERGLLVCTLRGKKNVKSRYALGWMPIGTVAAEWLQTHHGIAHVVDRDAWKNLKPDEKKSPPDFTVIHGGKRA